jgi:hypothetical protein
MTHPSAVALAVTVLPRKVSSSRAKGWRSTKHLLS